MATLSLDLRERIVTAYDKGEGTRDQIAQRFCVSLGMVKKLLQQRSKTGCLKPRHHLSGRKKLIVAEHRIAIRKHLKRKPDMTLAELREVLGLECTLHAIHYVLVDMGLTYKKRRFVQPNKTAKTSASRGGAGSASKAG
jgi:transposase